MDQETIAAVTNDCDGLPRLVWRIAPLDPLLRTPLQLLTTVLPETLEREGRQLDQTSRPLGLQRSEAEPMRSCRREL
jgi:hypothetical protein